ncbi:MAG: peptidoglycan-binding domain-containing protein [Candidatus Omnitrophota bacterium]
MRKMYLYLIMFFSFTFLLMGCATGKKSSEKMELDNLRSQVSNLESQLQEKDDSITDLESALQKEIEAKQVLEQKQTGSLFKEVLERPTARQIQVALQKAGFDPGIIDGRIGPKTREAIKAFQAANGLGADGRVGKETWAKLKEYLVKKVK